MPTAEEFLRTTRQNEQAQQPQISENEVLMGEISSLRQEIQRLKALQGIQIPQSENPLHSLQSLISAMTALQSYNNSVISGYQNTVRATREDILSHIPEDSEEYEGEERSPENELLSLFLQGIRQGGVAPTAPPAPVVPNYQEVKPMEQPNYDEILRQIPQFVKDAIRSGSISYDQFADAALKEAQKRGVSASELQIKTLYAKIKGGQHEQVQKVDSRGGQAFGAAGKDAPATTNGGQHEEGKDNIKATKTRKPRAKKINQMDLTEVQQ